MGVLGLTTFLQKTCPTIIHKLPKRLKDLKSRRVVIDGTLITQRLHYAPSSHPFRHVLGWYLLARELNQNGISAVCIFDGEKRSKAKEVELARRQETRRLAAFRGALELQRTKRLSALKSMVRNVRSLGNEDKSKIAETLKHLHHQDGPGTIGATDALHRVEDQLSILHEESPSPEQTLVDEIPLQKDEQLFNKDKVSLEDGMLQHESQLSLGEKEVLPDKVEVSFREDDTLQHGNEASMKADVLRGEDELFLDRDQVSLGEDEVLQDANEVSLREDGTLLQEAEASLRQDKVQDANEISLREDATLLKEPEPEVREDGVLPDANELSLREDATLLKEAEASLGQDGVSQDANEVSPREDETLPKEAEALVREDKLLQDANEASLTEDVTLLKETEASLGQGEVLQDANEVSLGEDGTLLKEDEASFKKDAEVFSEDEVQHKKDEDKWGEATLKDSELVDDTETSTHEPQSRPQDASFVSLKEPPVTTPVSSPLVEDLKSDLWNSYRGFKSSISKVVSLPLPEVTPEQPSSLPFSSNEPNAEEDFVLNKTQRELTLEEGKFWDELTLASIPTTSPTLQAPSLTNTLALDPTSLRSAETLLDSLRMKSEVITNSYQRRMDFPTSVTYSQSKEILEAMGVLCYQIEGEHEGEAMASSLVLNGLADYVVSEDSDVLVYEAPMIRSFSSRDSPLSLVYGSDVRSALDLSKDSYIDFALLLGTDFSQRIKNVGPTRAYKFIKEYGTIENILDSQAKYQPKNSHADYLAQINLAREIYRSPPPISDCLASSVLSTEFGVVDESKIAVIMERCGLGKALVSSTYWGYEGALSGNYFNDAPGMNAL